MSPGDQIVNGAGGVFQMSGGILLLKKTFQGKQELMLIALNTSDSF